jgi:O-antigen ligase
LVAALVLGGGTRAGFLSDAALQLLALPLLLVSLWRYAHLPTGHALRKPLIFCIALALVPLTQLIPLPPAIWMQLPNRQTEVETFTLLQKSLPWMPLSLAPSATWLSALSLIVPVGVLLGTAQLGRDDRRRLSLVVLAVGAIGVFLGLSQVAQGPSSALRFFDFSNLSEAVGFFANRNHYAALLYSLTLFAAAWAVDSTAAASAMTANRRFETSTILIVLASFTCLVALIGAQAMARSRGGLGLTIVALLGAFALSVADRRTSSGITPAKLLVVSVGLALLFATQFALYRIMDRFASDPLQDARVTFARITFQAAKSFLPFGSGMGTFVPVYAQFEKPADVLVNTYANRAHNDLLEMSLETGAVGLTLLGIFLVWLVLRSLAVWRQWSEQTPPIDASLARAASVVIALLLAHSLLDYPLRTATLMALFAFACALLIEPPASTETVVGRAPAERRVRAPASSPAEPRTSSGQLEAAQTGSQQINQWGKDVEWPEAWKKPPRNGPKK